jgi:predicted ATPase/class 3 adenylate cyclase
MISESKRMLAAVMFTDIVGYTSMMHSDELTARKKVRRHRQVVEEEHQKFNGQIISFAGDGSLSIFSSSVNAVKCAIEIQIKLRSPIDVPVRIGIDVGDIVIEKDSILGDAVNLASRIESFSIPGAVLVSDAVHKQTKNHSQFVFKSVGKFDFKNVPNPVELHALTNDGLIVPEASELEGKGQIHSDSKDYLPKVFTSFLGRKKEIDEIKVLLQSNKLITLTGPGGTGKTRLSIQVAGEVKNDFKDGIFWVPLTSVKDTNTVVMAISEHLGLQEDPILSIEEVVIQFFKEKHALIILDNFEHIVKASYIVERLLQSCSKLSIIVSSRIVLQIPGEMEYRVPPLNIPELDLSNSLEDLKNIPSIALFTERAQASRPNFRLTEDNAETIAEICVRLDGLPLGIELAAARIKIFSSKSLLNRLNKTFDVLKGGGQFPERHQTMRNTIAWSYDLLEPQEQKLLCQVSVFVGGFTMEAIEMICGEIRDFEWDVVDGVMALVDKSLLRTEETEDDLRFYMLETIREYALDELEKGQNIESIKESFINYFLKLSEESSPHFFGSKAEVWSPVIHRELANLRAAVDYAIELEKMFLAYRLAQALMPFWVFRGMNANEAVQQLEKIASVPAPESLSEERYKILLHLARFYHYTPHAPKAIPIFEECLAYWRQKEDQKNIGLVLNDFGFHIMRDGKYEESNVYSLEAKSIFEKLSHKERLVASINNIGMSYMWRGRPLEAIPYFRKNLDLTQELGDNRRNAQALINTAYCNRMMDELELAEEQLQESLITFQKGSSRIFEETALLFISYVYHEYGEYEKCRDLSFEIEQLAKETRTVFALGSSLERRAMAEYGLGNLEEAKSNIEKSREILNISLDSFYDIATVSHALITWGMEDYSLFRSICNDLLSRDLSEGNYTCIIPGLEYSALEGARQGKFDIATQLFFNAQAIRNDLSTPIPKSRRKLFYDLVRNLKDNLSDKQFDEAQNNLIEKQNLITLAKEVVRGI